MRKRISLIRCINLLFLFVGCGKKANVDNSAEKTLHVDIDAEAIMRIDLYWSYRLYTIQREDSSNLIDKSIEMLNGEYAVYSKWINNGTGSGNHIDLYDSEGNVLKTYYIFISEDGQFSIWEEGTEHFNYQREISKDNLQEIVKTIAIDQYFVGAG